MLVKGIATKKANGICFVWSRDLNKEALLDDRSKAVEQKLNVGSWVAFDVDDDGFISQYTRIPSLLPSRVNNDGFVELRTIISFPTDGDYSTDILAHSDDLGRVGIFRNFENLSASERYDVWVVRVPTWQANLERYFNVTWCISEETPVRIGYENGKGISSPTSHALCSTFETVDEKSTMNWEHVQEFPGSAVNENDFPGTGTGRFFRSESSVTVSCSDGMSANSWKFSSKRFPSKWTSDVGSDKTAAEKFAANSLPLDTAPLSLLSTMNCQMSSLRNDSEENRLVGIVTAFHARVGFLWCPELGEVIITMANVAMSLKHGDWVSFIPRGTNEGRLKFMAQWIRKIPQLYHAEQFANSVMVETVVFLSADYSASDSLFHAEYFGDAFDDKGVVRRFVQENGLYDALLVGLTKQNPLKFYGQSWKIAKVIRPIEVSSWTRTQESSAVQKGFSSCTSQHYDSNLTDEVQKSLRL